MREAAIEKTDGAGSAAQSSRRRAETARQRTLDSALRAEDAQQRKHAARNTANAIAQISQTLVGIAKAASEALRGLTKQVTEWVETLQTVQSDPEPEEKKHEEAKPKKEQPRWPSPGM